MEVLHVPVSCRAVSGLPSIPPPAWCPECGGDHAGDSATCPSCGHDAGGELVLYARLIPRRELRRRRAWWTLGAPLAWAAALAAWISVVPTDDKPVRGRDLPLFLLMPVLFGVALLILGMIWHAWMNATGSRRRAWGLRLSRDGWRRGQGPGVGKRWTEWWPTTKLDFDRAAGGGVRVAVGDRDRHATPIPADLTVPPGVSADGVVELARRWQTAATGRRPDPRVEEITHCPQCGHALLVPREASRPGACPRPAPPAAGVRRPARGRLE